MGRRAILTLAGFLAACGARSALDSPGSGEAGSTGSGAGVGTGGEGPACLLDGESCTTPSECCAEACVEGICGEVYCEPTDPPEAIANGLTWAIGPVAAGGVVFVSSYDEDGAVFRIQKDGSGIAKVADLEWPHDVTVGTDRIFVSTESRIVTLPRTGPGAPDTLASTFGGAGIALSGNRVVWAEYFGMNIKAVSTSGANPETLTNTAASPFRLQVHAGDAYYTATELYRVPIDGGAVEMVTDTRVRSFAVDDDGTVFVSHNQGSNHDVRVLGGPILYTGDAFIDGVSVDADGVYVFENGRVFKLSKDGMDPLQILWEGDTSAGLMGQDRDCLYVPIRPSGGPDDEDYLLKIAKP